MSAPEALAVAKCELGPGQKDTLVETAQLHSRFRGALASARLGLQAFSEDPRKCGTVIRVWNSGTRYNVLYLSRKGNTL